MPYFLNLVYLLLFLAASPWLLYKTLTTGKYRQGLLRKSLGLTPIRNGNKPCVWFHAVSVGEVLLLKQVIARFRQRNPEWECVLSTTTNTGFDVAGKTYPDLCVFYWPLDFTWAVKRALQAIRPQLIVLAELEIWPTFVAVAKRRGCAVAVINGRMSPHSFRGYSRMRWFMSRLLNRVNVLAVQNDDYADRLRRLGATPARIHVTGSVKYDGVNTDRNNTKTRDLAQILSISGQKSGVGSQESAITTADHSRLTTHRSLLSTHASPLTPHPVWIVGSTQAPEEEIALGIYSRAKQRFPQLRLILVPRHKERFEEVAQLLARSGLPFARRSQLVSPLQDREAVVLLDTLGELGALWGLADVAFVGGSLTPHGGQNMIEPAAYGAAVMFGPHVWNFQDTVSRLLQNHAAIQVKDAAEWESQTIRLLGDAAARAALGVAAQQFVQSQQGAAERTLELLEGLIAKKDAVELAA